METGMTDESKTAGGWQPHKISRGNAHGVYEEFDALIQVRKEPAGEYTMPFGLAQMDNGEIAFICSSKVDGAERPFISFSTDGGARWTDFTAIPDASGRPMMLTWLGGGRLSFEANVRFFSADYGRTWEGTPARGSIHGGMFGTEGNGHVDLDPSGTPAKVMEIGYQYDEGKHHPKDDATGIFRWSTDGGRSWAGEVRPKEWKFTEAYGGKQFLRGVSEGALVRAANGWLVAALRSDVPARYLHRPNDDSLEGTGISISRDDGQTWSEMDILYDAGRHHANLLRMPDGALVLTMIVRDDVRNRELMTHNRGCDALVSHDNGRTWHLDQRYVLDAWPFYDASKWYNGECGHLYSICLDDEWVLTAYGHYVKKSAVLVKWKPLPAAE